VCRTTEVQPIVALVFVNLFDYMTLRSASVVSIDNVHVGTSFPLFGLQRYEHHRCSIALQLHSINLGIAS
jgi:hypothetical protein